MRIPQSIYEHPYFLVHFAHLQPYVDDEMVFPLPIDNLDAIDQMVKHCCSAPAVSAEQRATLKVWRTMVYQYQGKMLHSLRT